MHFLFGFSFQFCLLLQPTKALNLLVGFFCYSGSTTLYFGDQHNVDRTGQTMSKPRFGSRQKPQNMELAGYFSDGACGFEASSYVVILGPQRPCWSDRYRVRIEATKC